MVQSKAQEASPGKKEFIGEQCFEGPRQRNLASEKTRLSLGNGRAVDVVEVICQGHSISGLHRSDFVLDVAEEYGERYCGSRSLRDSSSGIEYLLVFLVAEGEGTALVRCRQDDDE